MTGLQALKKMAGKDATAASAPRRQAQAEYCELCAIAIPGAHSHLMDPRTRELICTCDGCAVLFDSEGKTKYRRVPRDVRGLPNFVMPTEQWEKLLLPVNLAFFYKSSHAGRVVALYPSPAGVTESLLELEAWEAIAKLNPDLAEMQEDVEGFLVNRIRSQRDHWIVPIDRCFELVGILKTHWKGFHGGDLAWEKVAEYFEKLRKQAR